MPPCYFPLDTRNGPKLTWFACTCGYPHQPQVAAKHLSTAKTRRVPTVPIAALNACHVSKGTPGQCRTASLESRVVQSRWATDSGTCWRAVNDEAPKTPGTPTGGMSNQCPSTQMPTTTPSNHISRSNCSNMSSSTRVMMPTFSKLGSGRWLRLSLNIGPSSQNGTPKKGK